MKNFIHYRQSFPNFVPSTHLYSTSWEREHFKKTLKKQGKDWIYRKKEISYSYNEQGFRERPFNEIDWKESVVIFGCSHVEGIGLAKEDTISKQLEKIIERPVVNLGIGGTGVDIACWNSTILHEYYDKPKAVVHVWSSTDRYTDKIRDTSVIRNCVPGHSHYFGKSNWEFRSIKYVETDRALWKNKTIYYEASFFELSAEQLNIAYLKKIDVARDLSHPGIESAKAAAEKIAKNLVKLGL